MTEREPRLFILVVGGRLQVTLSFLRLPVLPAPVLPAPPWPARPFGPSHPLSCHSCIPPLSFPRPPLSFPRPPSVIPAVFSGNPQVGSLPTAETQTAGFPIKDVGNDRKRATPFHSCCGRSSLGHAILPVPPCHARPCSSRPSLAFPPLRSFPPPILSFPRPPLCHSRSF